MNLHKALEILTLLHCCVSFHVDPDRHSVSMKDTMKGTLFDDFLKILLFREDAECNWLTSFMCNWKENKSFFAWPKNLGPKWIWKRVFLDFKLKFRSCQFQLYLFFPTQFCLRLFELVFLSIFLIIFFLLTIEERSFLETLEKKRKKRWMSSFCKQ